MLLLDEVNCLFKLDDFLGQTLLNLLVLLLLLLDGELEDFKLVLHLPLRE